VLNLFAAYPTHLELGGVALAPAQVMGVKA
jgi:hypothetical protein